MVYSGSRPETRLRRESRRTTPRRTPTNDAEERIFANDAEERVPANVAEEKSPANDAEECIPANLQLGRGPRWALSGASRTSGLHRSPHHENVGEVYQVHDDPTNILEALQSAGCDMWKDAIEYKLEALANYGTFEYGIKLPTHICPITSMVVL